MRPTRLALLAAVFALSAGCGSDSLPPRPAVSTIGAAPAPSAGPTSDYVMSVNAACMAVSQRVLTVPTPTSTATPDGVAYARRLAVLSRALLGQLEAVPGPDDLRAQAKKTFFDPYRNQLTTVDNLLTAVEAGNAADSKRLSAEAAKLRTQINAAAAMLGFTSCLVR